MKKPSLIFILAFLGTTVAAAQHPTQPEQLAMPPGTFNHFYAPHQPFKVTIESENGLVSVLEVPQGVFLSVQAREAQNPDYHEHVAGPRTFRGEIILRLRRADEIATKESRAAQEIMAKSPLEMHLTNAVVVVEKM